jgi:hypothetical protein
MMVWHTESALSAANIAVSALPKNRLGDVRV